MKCTPSAGGNFIPRGKPAGNVGIVPIGCGVAGNGNGSLNLLDYALVINDGDIGSVSFSRNSTAFDPFAKEEKYGFWYIPDLVNSSQIEIYTLDRGLNEKELEDVQFI